MGRSAPVPAHILSKITPSWNCRPFLFDTVLINPNNILWQYVIELCVLASETESEDSPADPRAICFLCSRPYYEHSLHQEFVQPSTPSLFSGRRSNTSIPINLSLSSLSTSRPLLRSMQYYIQPPSSPLESVSTNPSLLFLPSLLSAMTTG